MGIGNTLSNLLQGVTANWQPSDKFLQRGIGNICKKHIFAAGLPIPYNPWPEGIDYPPEQLSEVIR